MSDKLADELSIVTRRYNTANVGEPGLVVKGAPNTPTIREIADEIEASEREFRPMSSNVGDVEQGIAVMVASKKPGAATPVLEDYDFVRIGQQLADSMIATGQQQLEVAQKTLHELQAAAANIMQIVNNRHEYVLDLRARQLKLGNELLDAIDKFHRREASERLAEKGEGGL